MAAMLSEGAASEAALLELRAEAGLLRDGMARLIQDNVQEMVLRETDQKEIIWLRGELFRARDQARYKFSFFPYPSLAKVLKRVDRVDSCLIFLAASPQRVQ